MNWYAPDCFQASRDAESVQELGDSLVNVGTKVSVCNLENGGVGDGRAVEGRKDLTMTVRRRGSRKLENYQVREND